MSEYFDGHLVLGKRADDGQLIHFIEATDQQKREIENTILAIASDIVQQRGEERREIQSGKKKP
jgi:hypothetical protein